MATASLLMMGLGAPAAGETAPAHAPAVAEAMHGLPAAHPGAEVSAKVEAPIPFSLIGFEVPDDAELEFRTSVDGATWTPWQAAEMVDDEGPDVDSEEARNAAAHTTPPIWVGEATSVQTRVGGSADAAPEDVVVHLVDSAGLGRSWGQRIGDRLRAAWRGTPAAAMDPADIVTRAEWGADESMRRSAPSYAAGIRAGFVHHTAGSNDYTREQSPSIVQAIYKYHVAVNGWSDIGYNFLVDKYGTVYEGRYGGITHPVIGAHASGYNTETFGVSLMGSFQDVAPPAAMMAGLRDFLAWKYAFHGVSPLGETPYGTTMIDRLSGHRDVGSTACPGNQTYDLLPQLREDVAAGQGPAIFGATATPSTVDVVKGESVSGAVSIGATLRPEGTWRLRIKDPAGTVVDEVKQTVSTTTVAHQWQPQGVAPGEYRYIISSPDRRWVRGTVILKAPDITGTASRSKTKFAPDGSLRPVDFSGTLYSGAQWALRIFDPAGERVGIFEGVGDTFARSWKGPVSVPGTYTWRLRAAGAPAVVGHIKVHADFVDRTGASPKPAAAAAGISRRTFDPLTAVHAVLTPLNRADHALAAGPLAGTLGPVLYTGGETLPDETLNELERVLRPGGTVYVMGDAISNTALRHVDARRKGRWHVHRVEGTTSAAVSAAAAPLVQSRSGSTTVILAGNSGESSWRQGLAAGGYGAAAGHPVLLTERWRLSPAAAEVIARPNVTAVTVIGNSHTVSADVLAAVRAKKSVSRVAGDTAADTAVAVARKLFARTAATHGDRWVFANATLPNGWARAYAAVPLAATMRAPLLVTRTDDIPKTTVTYLDSLGYGQDRLGYGTVLGSEEHIGGAVRTTLAWRLQ